MSFFWRATLNWFNTAEGLQAQNVLHFEDPSDTKTAEQIGAIIDTVWWSTGSTSNRLTNYTSSNVKLASITLQRLFPGPALGGIPFVTTQTAGAQGTGVVHPVLGFVFTLKDGLAGKKHRGRFYHYGAVPSHLLKNGPSPAIMGPTAIPTLITRWLNEFGPLPVSGLHWCLFHRGEAGAAQFTRITSIQLAQRAAVQRRRNFGVGI
jgi:hypothetical protein